MVQELLEDMLGGEVQEAGGDVLDLAAHLPQMTGDRRQRDTGGVQFGGDGEFLRAGDEELVVPAGDAFQDAQFHGLGERRLIGAAPEGGVQLGAADAGRLLVGPRPVDLGDQAQDPAEVTARVPGLEEFLDAGEGVAAVEQIGDLAQPGQMGIAVDIGPAAAFRAGKQSAVLVGTDGAHRGAAEVRQVLDAVLGGAALARGRLLGHCGAPYEMAARYEPAGHVANRSRPGPVRPGRTPSRRDGRAQRPFLRGMVRPPSIPRIRCVRLRLRAGAEAPARRPRGGATAGRDPASGAPARTPPLPTAVVRSGRGLGGRVGRSGRAGGRRGLRG